TRSVVNAATASRTVRSTCTSVKRTAVVRRPVKVVAKKSPAASASATNVAPGMRIALDPETRLPVKPSREQAAAVSTDDARLVPVGPEPTLTILPDGTKRVDLGESAMQYSIARRDASGKPHHDCASGLDPAPRLIVKPPVS